MLLSEFLTDLYLRDFINILDEDHERILHTDVFLSLLKDTTKTRIHLE